MTRFAVRALAALLLALPLAATATPFSRLIVFGDSLSDNGNLYALTGGTTPPPPYYAGRFSNGPVWGEYLASMYGVTLEDHAVGGALTGPSVVASPSVAVGDDNEADIPGVFDAPGLGAQVAAFTPGADYGTSLVAVWAGANDLRAVTNPADGPAVIGNAVNNLVNAIFTLNLGGPGEILVPLMPDLGRTPAVNGDPLASAGATALSIAFNNALIGALTGVGLLPSVKIFDTFSLVQDVTGNPPAYGFTNGTQACLATSCVFDPVAQNGYVFWDDIHPTTAAHQLLASEFRAALPEPATLALVLLAATIMVTIAPRARRTASARA